MKDRRPTYEEEGPVGYFIPQVLRSLEEATEQALSKRDVVAAENPWHGLKKSKLSKSEQVPSVSTSPYYKMIGEDNVKDGPSRRTYSYCGCACS